MAGADFYVIEMPREWRPDNGRYWRPGGVGYTDNIAEAGIYPADHPHIQGLLTRKETHLWSRAVPLDEALGLVDVAAAPAPVNPLPAPNLCVVELHDIWRRGRGRYWRVGHGYTDDPNYARLFDPAHPQVQGLENASLVPVSQVLAELEATARAQAQVAQMINDAPRERANLFLARISLPQEGA